VQFGANRQALLARECGALCKIGLPSGVVTRENFDFTHPNAGRIAWVNSAG
jgi:hypothetical protein